MQYKTYMIKGDLEVFNINDSKGKIKIISNF